jgi:hypothetical protein
MGRDDGRKAELQSEDLAEKPRGNADKVAREKLEEANREDMMNIHESRNSDPIQEEQGRSMSLLPHGGSATFT